MKKVIEGRMTSPLGDRIHPVTKKKTFHNGIDVSAPVGTAVLAPFSGVVVASYVHPTGGQTLILKADNGDRAGFCHLNDMLKGVGQRFIKGEMVAKSGNTGRSTGPHLHYTYALAKNINWATAKGAVINEKWENPADYLVIEE